MITPKRDNMTSSEWHKWKCCESKRKFSSKKIAKDHAKRMKKKGLKHLHVYECQYCDGWHTTKTKP